MTAPGCGCRSRRGRHGAGQGEDGRRRHPGPPARSVERVDWALGHAATYGRFAEGDLASILAAHPAGERRSRRRRPLAAGRHPRLGRLRSSRHDRRHRRTRRRGRRTAPPAPPAAHAPPRPRRAGHRQSATLGTRRSRPRAARRRARRPPSLLDQHPTGRGRVPHRQDLRHLGRDRVSSIPAPTQRSLATLEWIDRHENLVVCGPSGTGKTHLLEALGHAAIDHGCHVQWFSPRSPRRARAPPPRRRHHQPGDPQADARRPDLHRRHRTAPGQQRHRRSPLPRRRRRLRETLHRPVLATFTPPGSTN